MSTLGLSCCRARLCTKLPRTLGSSCPSQTEATSSTSPPQGFLLLIQYQQFIFLFLSRSSFHNHNHICICICILYRHIYVYLNPRFLFFFFNLFTTHSSCTQDSSVPGTCVSAHDLCVLSDAHLSLVLTGGWLQELVGIC